MLIIRLEGPRVTQILERFMANGNCININCVIERAPFLCNYIFGNSTERQLPCLLPKVTHFECPPCKLCKIEKIRANYFFAVCTIHPL